MNVKGTVGILCSKDSFLAQSLKSKLEENRLGVFLSHGDIEEMGRVRDNLDLIVLFMDNEMKDLADALSKALENGDVEVLKIDRLDGENHEDGRKDQ